MRNRRDIDAIELRRKLSYAPEVGVFRWAASGSNCVRNGALAGTVVPGGYIQIKIFGSLYQAQRLAWFYVYGLWPKQNVDHINGDPGDNRIANLRDVSQQWNSQNQRRPTRANSTGFLGVSPYGKKFRATIKVDGRQRALGYFATAPEAHQAYLLAKREFHAGGLL